MKFETDVDLTCFNTLAVTSVAKFYCRITSVASLLTALSAARSMGEKVYILGGGSNVILPRYVNGVIIHLAVMGRHVTAIDDRIAEFEVGAGENWHELVEYSIAQGYRGLENLSLIPGTAGAAPIQNIGAYGVEIKDILKQVSVIDLEVFEEKVMPVEALNLSYRDSLFKQQPGRYVITSITLKLDKKGLLKTDYGDLQQRLPIGLTEANLTAHLVSSAVVQARQSKLPDYRVLPNAGSFFKNPMVGERQLNALKQQFPDIIYYPMGEGVFKLAAGWLIQQAGLKGYANELVGVHKNQALVLINHNHGDAKDILALANKIQHTVDQMFEVSLEIEPVIF